MTVLPIIERELRVRARSAAGYWTRFCIGLTGMVVTVPVFVSPMNLRAAANLGPWVFHSLVATAFVLCCSASLLTADVISREHREGTLGLLLLTRVRGFDVLLGKLCSSGIACLCGLVALLPLLMIPILAGGVTGGEVVRQSLALLNTLFLALTVGLWASASQKERARAIRVTILTLVAISLFPLFCFALVLTPFAFVVGASPLMTIIAASDSSYRSSPAAYWASVAVGQVISWLFILGAAKKLVRLHTEGDSQIQTEPGRVISVSPTGTTMAPQLTLPFPGSPARANWKNAVGLSPVEWLVRRQRGLTLLLWAGAVIGFFHYASYLLYRPYMGWTAWAIVGSLPGLTVALLSSACFAFVASRFFMEARRSGELELLLSTPLGAKRIILDQWKALERLMIGPALFLIGLILLRLLPLFTSNTVSLAIPMYTLLSAGMALVNTVAGLAAICWVGLWFGLKARTHAAAVLWTAGLAKGVPYLFGIILSLLLRFMLPAPLGYPTGFLSALTLLLPSIAVLVFYVWLTRIVRARLASELAGAEL